MSEQVSGKSRLRGVDGMTQEQIEEVRERVEAAGLGGTVWERYIIILDRKSRKTGLVTYSPYMTIDGRVAQAVEDARKANGTIEIETWCNVSTEPITILDGRYVVPNEYALARVRTPHGEASGTARIFIGGEGPNEDTPVEVAETSAVGRALGFLGYGLIPGSGIASAEEMQRALGKDGEREAQGKTQWQGTTEGAVRQGQEETVAVSISDEGVPAKLAEFRAKFLATINPQFTRPASEKQQGLAVSCLEALFPGKGEEQRTNLRYDLSRFMVGKASSKDYTSGEASAFIEWAIIGKDEATGKTDYTPRLHAQQAAERVINWLAEQKGQTKMAVETEAGLPY